MEHRLGGASVGDTMKRLVVIGSSISGSLAACYLKIRFPDLHVVSIQKSHAKFPIVGESLTEFSTLLLHEIGLGAYLEEQHFHKYGLTFYFKERIDNPASYTYATHEAMRIPPMPSNQVNRLTLAVRLRARARELGVEQIDGTVKDVAFSTHGPHRIVYTSDDGQPVSLDTDWIVDASGRNRFLANKLGLKRAPRYQRSSFWFRLEGFDKRILERMQHVKTPHHCFDSYYVTHHFFGKHNWIWAIPMRPDRPDCDLISIGIVYRPDLYDGEVTSLDTFLAHVGAEHPALADMVRSGTIVDTNVYRNYFYEATRLYDRQGWFIIGDAGDTVDPLYSTGMSMTAIQVKQVAAIIASERNGTCSDEYVADLERLYKTIRDSLQLEISTLYEVMADPFQAHLRMHCASAFYFFVLLPSWLCGYISDPVGAKVLLKVLQDGTSRLASLKALLPVASRRLGALPATAIENLYGRTVNWNLRGPAERAMPRDIATCALFFARVRFHVLRRAGWHRWPTHLAHGVSDLARAALFGLIVGRRAIKELRVVRMLLGSRPVIHGGRTRAIGEKISQDNAPIMAPKA